jgi:ADP-ribose pyrophosphatase YjhB (NUDIX family)
MSGKVERRKRLLCKKCGWINYDNPLPVTVCLVKDKQGKVLLIKRGIPPAKNYWALPGGFVDAREDPEKACIRELWEETGIKGKIKRLSGVYIRKKSFYGAIIIIGYEVDPVNGRIKIGPEIKDLKFVDRKNLPYIPFDSHRRIIRKAFRR